MEHINLFKILPPSDNDHRAAAVIVAAGNFTRMGGIAKQFVLLNDIPVIAHTVRAFQQAEQIQQVVIVAKPDDMDKIKTICLQNNFNKVSCIVGGGSTRQQSVYNGVKSIKGHSSYYAIHDGARPLVKSSTIDSVVKAAWKYGAATAAVPVKDTIKVADDNCLVVKTLDRSCLWSIQTPQAFESSLYINAIKSTGVEGKAFTDDCQLVETLGHKVYLVKSDYENIKITTPEDIFIAKSIINSRSVT